MYKETVVYNMPTNDYSLKLVKDSSFKDYIYKSLSNELLDKLKTVLEYEDEITVTKIDFKVSENPYLDSIEYKEQLNWEPLVRCKNCAHYKGDYYYNFGREVGGCEFLGRDVPANGYCYRGIKKEHVVTGVEDSNE